MEKVSESNIIRQNMRLVSLNVDLVNFKTFKETFTDYIKRKFCGKMFHTLL